MLVRTNKGSVVEAGMHTGLADVADLLHLRDHRVRVEDVVGMDPDRGRNVRPRLLLFILEMSKNDYKAYKKRKTLLGTTILTCIEHRRALLFKTAQRRLHIVQSFLFKSIETQLDTHRQNQ